MLSLDPFLWNLPDSLPRQGQTLLQYFFDESFGGDVVKINGLESPRSKALAHTFMGVGGYIYPHAL